MRRSLLSLSLLILFVASGYAVTRAQTDTPTPTATNTPTITPTCQVGSPYNMWWSGVNFDDAPFGPVSESTIPGSPTLTAGSFRASGGGNFTPRGYYGGGTSGTKTMDITWTLPALTHISSVQFDAGGSNGWGGDSAAFNAASEWYLYIDGALVEQGNPRRTGVDNFTHTHNLPSPGFHSTIRLRIEQGPHPGNAYGEVSTQGMKLNSNCMASITPTPPPGVTASFIPHPDSGTAPLFVEFENTSEGAIIAYGWSFGDSVADCSTLSYDSTATEPTHTYTEPGEYTACLRVSNDGGTSIDIETQTIYVIDGSPGAQVWSIPLGPEDQNGYLNNLRDGMYSASQLYEDNPGWTGVDYYGDNDWVFSLANRGVADVMAVHAGEVADVRPITYDMCNLRFRVVTGWCVYEMPQPVHGTGVPPVVFGINRENAYSVVVQHGDAYWTEYWVTNPRAKIGDTISEACTLGQTLPISPIGLGLTSGSVLLSLTIPELGFVGESVPLTGASLSIVGALDRANYEPVEVLPALVNERIPSNYCDESPIYAECFGDAEMRNPASWVISGPANWGLEGYGVTLNTGASIRMQVLLNSEDEYGLDVNIERLQDFPSSAAIALGTTAVAFDIVDRVGVYSIPSGNHEPDAGFYSSVYIENTGQSPLIITRACVSEGGGSGGGIPISGTCQLANFAFTRGLDGWTTSGVTEQPGIFKSVVVAEDDATLMQTVSLAPGGTTISVIFRMNGLNTPTFEYTLDGGDNWDPMTNDVSESTPLNWRASATTTVGGGSTEFGIRVQLSSGTTSLEQICISPDDLPTGGAIGPLPPFNPKCNARNAPPAADILNPGPWLFWHWSSMEQFFTCDLMILLTKLYNLGDSALRFMRWQMLYWQSLVTTWTSWTGKSLIPYLNGHFANVAVGRVTTINSAEQCNNLFCFGQTLIEAVSRFIGSRVDTIINLVSSILNLVASLFARIFEAVSLVFAQGLVDIVGAQIHLVLDLFAQAKTYLDAIIVGWNVATPTPIPGFPSCSINPKSSAFCMFIWAMDNTIFSGRGELLIPIIIGIGSICVLLIAFKMVRKHMIRAAQLS